MIHSSCARVGHKMMIQRGFAVLPLQAHKLIFGGGGGTHKTPRMCYYLKYLIPGDQVYVLTLFQYEAECVQF